MQLRRDREKRSVVIEHLLEVRDHPHRVHGVAAESTAHMVVQAATAHLAKRERRRREAGGAVRARGTRRMVAHQPVEVRRVRELRRIPEAAVARIVRLHQRCACEVECCPGQRRSAGLGADVGLQAGERVDERGVLAANVVAPFAVQPGHAGENLAERRHAVARRVGKVRAGEEGGVVVGGQHHRQRPAAGASGEELVGGLVDLVDVGTFLAIDLDTDVQLVHQPRRFLVLERFMRHDVAPVAGGIANRQQDRLVFAAGPVKRFRPPRLPVDGIVRVLQEVGTGFVREGVDVGVGRAGHGSVTREGKREYSLTESRAAAAARNGPIRVRPGSGAMPGPLPRGPARRGERHSIRRIDAHRAWAFGASRDHPSGQRDDRRS